MERGCFRLSWVNKSREGILGRIIVFGRGLEAGRFFRVFARRV